MNLTSDRIKTFIVENFLFGEDDGLRNEVSLLDEGIIDSTGVLELVDFLEQEFQITISDDELMPENLDSIDNICAFIDTKLQKQAS